MGIVYITSEKIFFYHPKDLTVDADTPIMRARLVRTDVNSSEAEKFFAH